MTDAIPSSNRDVSFGEAVRLFFSNYAQFNGRSSRGAFWWSFLFNFCVNLIFVALDGILFAGNLASPLSSLFSLAIFIPGIAVGVRRLHDTGRTGWWTLIALTVIGVLLLVYFVSQPGERRENKYGPDREQGKA